ncbi:hypothetical protein N0V90_005345 [Kalmusia sp. IMI 367209]|nr:hypothetical protein N0V90_005345 [Kalmusia sp. IMI 367209]
MPGHIDAAQARLTAAIIQLQTSINAYSERHNLPPHHNSSSAQTPTEGSTKLTTNGTPKSATDSLATPISPHLSALQTQLASFEHQLKQRNQWRIPPGFQPDPFLDIDLSDLDDAITHLQAAIEAPRFPQTTNTPHAIFSGQSWKWDFQWSSWYYIDPHSENHVYLTEWELHDDANEWVMVLQGHVSVEEGVAMLGCWEDWEWDEGWGEWYLGMGENAGRKRRMYASQWRKTSEGDWVYAEESRLDRGEE